MFRGAQGIKCRYGQPLKQSCYGELLERLRHLKVQTWERMAAATWQPLLSRCENILGQGAANPAAAVDEELLCEALRVVHDMVSLHPDLKGPVEKLRDLLQRSELSVLLGALRCLAVCPPSRHLQSGPQASALERRLEMLACGGAPSVLDGSLRDACTSRVSLPSGRGETVAVSQCGTIAELKVAAQQSFGQRFLRLAAPDGHLLDLTESIHLSGLQEGDSLTAIAQQPKIAATSQAFALSCVGGDRIVTWGHPDRGGDSSSVQVQLRNVQQICGNRWAFATILADGTVVTWGVEDLGGDSSGVQDQLQNVQQICGAHVAFAAILANGTVVTWGYDEYGGDSSSVQDQLKNVQQICSTDVAFAAILADRTVVTWGNPDYGGDSSSVQDQLRNVQQICGTGGAFAAILADGTVVTWGDPDYGGDSSKVQDQLKNVEQICGADVAFAAILADRTVVTWGNPDYGGDSSSVQDQLKNVQRLCRTDGAFAAILADATVVTWGHPDFGGDSSKVQDQQRTVQQIGGTEDAFAAILADATVVTWGNPDYGGDSSSVQDQLKNVQQICGTEGAFAAILGDGTVVTWGNPDYGGDSSRDYPLEEFRFELGNDASEPSVLRVTHAEAPAGPEAFEVLLKQLEASTPMPAAVRTAVALQLRLWCRARSLEGRREVVAIALFAICNAVKHIRPFVLQQYMQKRPGLLSELCELLQSLQAIGSEASVAVLRVTGGFLDSRFGQSRSEASQLSQMLGLSLPHGIVACALRGLLSQRPEPERLEEHNQVLLAAMDLFQITTVNNHQTTAQLGHAGMLHAMLELLEKTEVASLTVVTWMLRGLELVSEVSGTAALVLFRDFGGLQAFSVRLQREVALILALDSAETVVESDPPRDDAAEEEKQRFRHLFEEVTLRRRLCRQLLKNIQTALQCSEVLQGLAGIFQGQLTDALKLAVKAPMKMGLQLFGTAIDIVSSFIQDDPSRVPQMIESEVLPEIMGALNKDTLRSVESLNFVPGLLSSIALHAVGENFILSLPNKPVQLLTEAFIDVSYAGIMHTQPELVQVMGTQVEKVLRNRPAGPTKLTEHVVDCMLDTMRQVADQAKAYPDWTPLDLEDRTDFLPDRLAPLCRFCWSILSTNEAALKCFLERKGLSVVRELQELSCLPFHLTSLEGQQHPMASLFTLQVKGSEGNLAAAAELKEMLNTHLEKVVPTLKEMATGDPAAAIASMDSAEVVTFLRTLSRATAALESMLSVCRECSSTQVLEAVREPLRDIAPLAACTFVLAAWHSQERERLPATASYHETVRAVFAAPEKSGAEGCILKLDASVLGREVYLAVSKQLGPKKAGKPALYHLDSLLMLQQTLEEQGLRGTATLTCTYVPTDLYAAWCHVQGLPIFQGELALEGVTEIANTSVTKSLQNLPGSLEKLTLGHAFNESLEGVTLPSSLQSLKFGAEFNQSLEQVTLPSSLRTLTFGHNFNQSLERVSLPSTLENLTFGYNFTQSLEGWTLPRSLLSLTLDGHFNHSLEEVTLPSSLQILTFGKNFDQSLEQVTLPSSLQSLTFGQQFNQSLEQVTLPSSLESLTFGRDFNQSLEQVTLPRNLQSLTFGASFNQSLERVNLPGSLKSLTFAWDFNQNLEGVTLPSSLQSLTLGHDFNQNFEQINLPMSLQSLQFGRCFDKNLRQVTLPGSLQNLKFEGNFCKSLDQVTLPSSIQSLTLGMLYDERFEQVTLPNGLRSLTLGYDFNVNLEQVTLPSSLLSLTFGHQFNQSLEQVALPSSLENLTFGHDFNQSLERVILPSSLRTLTFGTTFNNFLGQALPDGLQSLTFSNCFNQSLEDVALPRNLQSLKFGSQFNQGLEEVTLPSSLESLTFGISFNQSLEEVTLPSNLRSIVFGNRFNKSLLNVRLPRGLRTLSLRRAFNRDGCNDAAETAMEVVSGKSEKAAAGTGAPESEPLLRAARQCFRLTCRTLRQLLQLATKLHSRRGREGPGPNAAMNSPAPGLARQLAQVARSILLAQRPENTAAALRWVGEVFDVLQKMHEEQNKVAVRPLALCTFYQAGGFDLLPPLIRFVADELGGPHAQIAGSSLTTAASYFEKLTAWKRYTHAMQIRPEDGLMLKEQLCHSIQAAAVKSLLPIWQSPRSFTNYPRSVCSSMLKVWLQMAQNEQLAVYGDERMMRPFRGKGPENGAAPPVRPNPERTSSANNPQVADSSIEVKVLLPSGRCETVAVSQSGTVADLKIAAQQSLGRRFLRLATADGRLLDPRESLRRSGVQEGHSIAAVAQQPKLAATSGAFALWCVECARAVTWGHPECGGDSFRVQDQLKNVQQICGTAGAFAAILADGSVVTWGSPDNGGDSSRVQVQLKNVQHICGTAGAFAAILADGSVVTWGDPHSGGDSSRVQDQLKNVQQICGAFSAFAAILADGSVVTWGSPDDGGDSSRVQHRLQNVQQICCTSCAFAAIFADGSVVTWGHPKCVGDSSRVQDQLKNVQQICGTAGAFAAILADGSVVTWGSPDNGGDSSRVQVQLKNVQHICGTAGALAAILADGSVVTWGSGDSSRVQVQLKNVQQICGTQQRAFEAAFAAILADGTVVTWGETQYGGDSSRVQDQLKSVQQICGTGRAFTAILADGSGDPEYVQGTLVDMGFTKAQVAAALNHFGPRGSEDIGQLIMWMVANPLNPEAKSENSGNPEVFVEPVKEIKEIRDQVMEDLLPRIFACGYDVPKALPAVVDTICALSEIAEPLWPLEVRKDDEEHAGSSEDENPEPPGQGPAQQKKELVKFKMKKKKKDVLKKGKRMKDGKDKFDLSAEGKGKAEEDYGTDKEQNLKVIIFRCLSELGSDDRDAIPPSEEKMSCVTQVLANLLHRRPNACRILGERKGNNGEHGMKHLLQKIHDWCVAGIDFTKSPEERGHRLIHCTGRAPAPPGVGDALLPAPAWFTPAVVCAQQLLCKAELVKYGDGTQTMQLELSLPSGRCASVSVSQSGTIADLKLAAQQSFGQRFLRLATAEGRLLDPSESLRLALRGGDSIAAVAQQPKIAATDSAFALWCVGADGVVTWGNEHHGGSSSQVQDQLRNVQQVCGTYGAFAAVLEDGSVVTWGIPDNGGDSSKVRHQLHNVQQIGGTGSAFAAILADGTVVTWGRPDHGGDSSTVQSRLRNVQRIHGTDRAFAAILADGSVVTWGDENCGGDSSRVQHQLENVTKICGTAKAFAAILADRSVVTWGTSRNGGDSSRVQDQLRNVQHICSTGSAFAAIVADGFVVTWGSPDNGGDSSRVQHRLQNVQQICCTSCAFAAILADGSVVTWGDPSLGGDRSRVQHQLKNVQQICWTSCAFAAILADGSVVTWGDRSLGGDSSSIQHQLKNVQQIGGTDSAFAAILADGTVVTWGNPHRGGDSSGRVLDTEIQQMWVTLALDILYAFPGLDGALAQTCLQAAGD
eukprot:s596_g1.t2